MEPTIEIKPVRTSAEKMSFIKFPRRIYGKEPHWVQPLISEQKVFFNSQKNPFFQHGEVELFLASLNKQYVGRIAAIIDYNYNEFHDERAGFFGCFETINKIEVARALFDAVINWLKEREMEIVYGPASFTINGIFGLLIEGFDSPPMVMMAYNPTYYTELIEGLGFRKARDLMAYYIKTTPIPERVINISERIQKRKQIRLRTSNLKQLDHEINILKKLHNKVFEKIWGFVPLTDSEINHMAVQLKRIAEPDLVIFAEIDDEPVGFIFSLPDFNQALLKLNGRLFPLGVVKLLWYTRRINQLRVITMGVLPEYRKWGIETLLYYKTFKEAIRLGYKGGEMSFVLEDNLMMNRAAKGIGATLYKKYRIYKKSLM